MRISALPESLVFIACMFEASVRAARPRNANTSEPSSSSVLARNFLYAIPIGSHRVRPPLPNSRAPDHIRSIRPSSPEPFTRSPSSHGSTGSARFLARTQPFHLSPCPTVGPLNPIQNP